MKIKNPVAEAAIRTLKGSCSSLMLHAGMSFDMWPLAVKYFEFSYNVNTMSRTVLDPPVTCFEALHGYPYEGYMIPFGALVWFRDTGGKSFEPKGSPAVYLGAEFIKGMKYKGNHKVWPLNHVEKGSIFVYVVRTLAFPNGKWQFPLREVGDDRGMGPIDSLVPPPELEDIQGERDLEREGDDERVAPKASSGSKVKDADPLPKKRNRSITALRIAIHGATPKCQGCKEGSYSHSKMCRDRFNGLIEICEPAVKDKGPVSGIPDERASDIEARLSRGPEPAPRAVGVEEEAEDQGSSGYAATTPIDSEIGDFEFEDPDAIQISEDKDVQEVPEMSGAMVASGRKSSEMVEMLDKGPSAVASIFFDAIEVGGEEEMLLSARLANAMNALPRPKLKRSKKNIVWFVEFACSNNSECSKLAHERGIPYIGFSRDVCDLSNPHDIEQIKLWARERISLGESLHLWGSLPYAAWPSWQNLNAATLDEEFRQSLQERRDQSRKMVSSFSELTDLAVESGGSSSFEWPRYCSGWVEVDELVDMIVRHNMFSSLPCGCSFSSEIKGKRPKKPWRIVSTNARLSAEMDIHRCRHPKGFSHDALDGGKLAFLSGFDNREMSISILCSLFPGKFLEGIPSFPVLAENEKVDQLKIERMMEQLGDGKCLHNAQALVHRVLSRKEIQQDPKAIESVRKEVEDIRAMGVWDDNSVTEYEQVKSQAKRNGEEIHLAEVMEIGSIKNDELGPSLSQHKGRLVFRGDLTRNQDGLPAKFRELHSQPASIMTIAIVLFYGMLSSNVVYIADAKKAYLQAYLRTTIPTWVVLPPLCWLPSWLKKYKRPTVRLLRPLYGHPEAGDDWFDYFSDTAKGMGLKTIEGFPSLWWDATTRVLVAAYVDDIVCAGGAKEVELFWVSLKKKIEIDGVEVPGRYLGRDHDIRSIENGKTMFMSMEKYCRSAVDLYLQHVGAVALKSVSTPYLSDSELNVNDWESQGFLGEKSASILMKILWLARLSRPDLSHGVTKLASGISRWSVNHDKMLHRLVSYMNATADYGVHCFVNGNPSDISLHLYTDADSGGDVCTMKSHTGIFLCIECPNGTLFPISWSSRRQQCVSKSTTESELVALNDGLYGDALPVQTVLQLIFERDIPLVLHEDNQACIQILNAGYSARLKSMNRTHKLSIAAISETIKDLNLELRYTVSEEQLADLFTKVLARVKFTEALRKLRIGPASLTF